MRGYSKYVSLLVAFTDFTAFFLISYVSELLYIHSKVMIVDDRRFIVTLSFLMLPNFPRILTLDHRWVRRTSTNVVKRCDYNAVRLS